MDLKMVPGICELVAVNDGGVIFENVSFEMADLNLVSILELDLEPDPAARSGMIWHDRVRVLELRGFREMIFEMLVKFHGRVLNLDWVDITLNWVPGAEGKIGLPRRSGMRMRIKSGLYVYGFISEVFGIELLFL